MEETVQELHSPIGIMDEELLSSFGAGEELPPTMEETVQELHSPIGIMDEELQSSFGVAAEKVSSPNEVVDKNQPYQGVFPKHVAIQNLNDTTRTTRHKLDQMVETCNPDQV